MSSLIEMKAWRQRFGGLAGAATRVCKLIASPFSGPTMTHAERRSAERARRKAIRRKLRV